ncbi:MAG: hypothetical protein ACRD3E_10700, partial [Terriglobales bacterium]
AQPADAVTFDIVAQYTPTASPQGSETQTAASEKGAEPSAGNETGPAKTNESAGKQSKPPNKIARNGGRR